MFRVCAEMLVAVGFQPNLAVSDVAILSTVGSFMSIGNGFVFSEGRKWQVLVGKRSNS